MTGARSTGAMRVVALFLVAQFSSTNAQSGVVDCKPRGWVDHAKAATTGCCAHLSSAGSVQSFTALLHSYTIVDKSGAMDSSYETNSSWTVSATGPNYRLDESRLYSTFSHKSLVKETHFLLGGKDAFTVIQRDSTTPTCTRVPYPTAEALEDMLGLCFGTSADGKHDWEDAGSITVPGKKGTGTRFQYHNDTVFSGEQRRYTVFDVSGECTPHSVDMCHKVSTPHMNVSAQTSGRFVQVTKGKTIPEDTFKLPSSCIQLL